MLKAVLFDMDGVIIDSEPLHAKAFQLSMKEYGLDLTDDYCYQFIGRTDLDMIRVLIKENNLPNTEEELLKSKNNMKLKLEQEVGYPPVPYIKELIADLHAHGIKLAIASSSPMEAIRDTAVTLGLTEYFTEYVSGMDLKHSKPAPDIFLKAAAMLGVQPCECMVIEDSEHGVAASKAAKIPCIGFYNPHSGNQNLSRADIIVEGFEEVDTEFLKLVYAHANREPYTIAKTNRLILRELSSNDMDVLYPIYQQPDISKVLDSLSDFQTEQAKLEAYIDHVYHFFHFGYWGVFLKEDHRLIGRCGIQANEIDGEMELELGYLIDETYQGNGYAYESVTATLKYAFETLNMNRIVAVIDQDNEVSKKIALKAGLTFEKEVIYHDRNCDLYVIHK